MASVVQICNIALARIGVRDFIQSLDDQTLQAEACALAFPIVLDEVTIEFDWPFSTRHSFLAQVGAPYAAWSGAVTYALGQNVTVAGTVGYFQSAVANNLNNAPVSGANAASSAFWTYFSNYTRTGWTFMYALPADYISVQSIQYQDDHGINGPFIPNPPYPPPSRMRTQVPNAFPREEFKVEADDAADGGSVLLTNAVAAELIYSASLQSLATFPPAFSGALSWALARDLAMAIPNKADYAKPAEAQYRHYLQLAIARYLNSGSQLTEQDSEFVLAR